MSQTGNEFQKSIEGAESKEEMKEEIQKAIDENKIIIFMKGNKLMPQCGYSMRALQTVAHYEDDVDGFEFETVDVLRDERIREALEEVTDWPTIPQIFVDGEFLGGSDTVYEMHEEGDLEDKIVKAFEN